MIYFSNKKNLENKIDSNNKYIKLLNKKKINSQTKITIDDVLNENIELTELIKKINKIDLNFNIYEMHGREN